MAQNLKLTKIFVTLTLSTLNGDFSGSMETGKHKSKISDLMEKIKDLNFLTDHLQIHRLFYKDQRST